MLKAYKYRIYPTDEQKVLLAKTFGCCCWFYNYSLNLTNETYKATSKGLIGVKDFCMTSDVSKYGNPNHYRKYEQKLAKKQKRLANIVL